MEHVLSSLIFKFKNSQLNLFNLFNLIITSKTISFVTTPKV